jgi:hypothetical protein
VWRIAIVCGMCLVLTGAAASGAPLSSASGTGSALNHALAPSQSVNRTHGTHVAQVILLGEQAIEPTVDNNSVDTVEAFAFRARRSGTAASIRVYLAARNRATTLFAGVYSSRHGHPQSRLAFGRLRSPKAGAWNSVATSSSKLRSGTTYWLAVLGKGGGTYFRDRNHGLCTGERSSKRKLRSLPRTWPGGPNSHDCLISAYVKGNPRASSPGTSGGGTQVFGTNSPSGTISTPTSTTPTTNPLLSGPCDVTGTGDVSGTTAAFHLCQLPDSTNTGYANAPGYPGSLTAQGLPGCPSPSSIQSNTTYSYCHFTSTVTLRGQSNVTFYGCLFEVPTGSGSHGVDGSGTYITIDYSTFAPAGLPAPTPEIPWADGYQMALYNEGGGIKGLKMEHNNIYGFADAIDTGYSSQTYPQTFEYNYVHDPRDSSPGGDHTDGIGSLDYEPDSYVTLDHNVIVSDWPDTNTNAIAFQACENTNCPYSHFTITNNFLAWGSGSAIPVFIGDQVTIPTDTLFEGNIYSAWYGNSYAPLHGTTFATGPGDCWQKNFWAVPPGSAWGSTSHNGWYWMWQTGGYGHDGDSDTSYVSQTDEPSCTVGQGFVREH